MITSWSFRGGQFNSRGCGFTASPPTQKENNKLNTLFVSCDSTQITWDVCFLSSQAFKNSFKQS